MPITHAFTHIAHAPPSPDGFKFATASVATSGAGLFLYVGQANAKDVTGATLSGAGARFP